MQGLERQVLELPLDLLYAEAVRERRVDLEGLGGDAALLRLGEDTQGAHVVQPVGELDQQHPDVAGHRHDHLPDVLGLLLFPGVELEPVELGETVDDPRDLGPEVLVDHVDGHVGVLDGVVQQRGLQRRGVEPQVGKDVGHRDRMRDEVLAGLPLLPLVRGLRERVGARDLLRVGLRVVGADLLEHRVDRRRRPRVASAQTRPRDARQPASAPLLRRLLDLLLDGDLFLAVHRASSPSV